MLSSAPLLRAAAALAALACAMPVLHGRALPTKPSHAQTEIWRQQGRDLPTPEAVQPTLDPALPPYAPRRDIELSGHVKGASSDVLAQLAKQWIAAFQKLYPKVTIDLPPPYAGSLGALELIKGDLQFVLVSRELKPSDVAGFSEKFGYAPFSAPVSGGTWRHFGFLDSIAFFVHPENPIRQLTLEQIDAIYSATRHRDGEPARTWGDLGLTGEWADKPIHAWGVKPWNGFEEFIRQRALSVEGKRGEWRPDINFTDTVFPLSEAVASDPYAIAYSGLAYIDDGLKQLAIVPPSGGAAVPPSYEAVMAARYPLSRLVYFNANKEPGQPLSPVLEEFLKFILSREGQQIILDQAVFIPLRAEQAGASRTLLQ
ncbi:MAG: substrate-binding domain-containing protein [Opitutaceae bacterium]|nr:substrate-binding domain-containing protein [Opitutaceae bacterium]